MRILIAIYLLILGGCSSGESDSSNNTNIAAESSTKVNFPAPPENIDFENIKSLPFTNPSETLSYADSPEQLVQFWPAGAPSQSTNIIFIHGGCWLNAFDITQSYPLATALSQSGFTVWSVEYRRAGNVGGGWPNTLTDIQLALTFIQSQQKAMGQTHTIVAGHSAGGHLALLATAESSDIDAVIGLSAIYDIESYARLQGSCPEGARLLLGGTPEDQPLIYMDANPAVQKLHPNVLLMHSELDQIVPLIQATGSGLDHIIQPGSKHFDWLHPESQSFDSFEFQLRKVIAG